MSAARLVSPSSAPRECTRQRPRSPVASTVAIAARGAATFRTAIWMRPLSDSGPGTDPGHVRSASERQWRGGQRGRPGHRGKPAGILHARLSAQRAGAFVVTDNETRVPVQIRTERAARGVEPIDRQIRTRTSGRPPTRWRQ